MIKLYINDVLIEGLDEAIRLTKAVNNLGDLPSRQGEFSNTINVPKTKNNCSALGFGEQQTVKPNYQFQKLTFELYESEVLISLGTARILTVNQDFEIVLLSDNSDWTGTISDKSLQDLDLSALDFSFLPAEVASRRLNTADVCFPNVWYGEYINPLRPFDVPDFMPAVFIDYLVNKIFSEIGYSIQNNLSASAKELWDKMVTIYSKKVWFYDLEGFAFHGKLYEQVNVIPNSPLNSVGGDYIYKQDSNITSVAGFPISGKSWFSSGFGAVHPPSLYRNWRINFGLEYTTIAIAGNVDVVVIMDHGSFIIGTVYIDTALQVYDFDFTTALVPAGITTSTTFSIDLTNVGGSGINIKYGEIWLSNDKAGKAPQLYSTSLEYFTNLSGALPDIKQSELIRTLFNQFSIICSTDTLKKIVTFTQLDSLVSNIHTAPDWTSKIDLTEPVEFIFDFWDNYFQLNEFIYKDDERDSRIAFTKTGAGSIAYPNLNLPPSGIVFESAFSAISRSFEWNGAVQTKELAQCESRTEGDLNWKLGVSEITALNLITQFGQSAPTQSNEISFEGLDFASLISSNYNALKAVFKNSKAIKCLLRLTRAEYNSIDFSMPIFLDFTTEENGHVRGHFYINLIDQYEVGENASCYVTLIQID
jgi:hypothetical protein